eukprot:TRINITY_DN4125_c0_g2_i1.p1 TRINITY_DN4125_c0_g2~~TRINITY_DN4125_c0_g2_i1.p1  ORF type:complete len:367 (+),score=61.69 TRINITY_DN4125_c0_g2_i1:53-1153(+)
MGVLRTLCRVIFYFLLAVFVALLAFAFQASRIARTSTESDIVAVGGVAIKHKDGRLTEVHEGGVKDGVPFFLFHCFNCDGQSAVEEVYNREYIKMNIRVIAPSLPGHSLSTIKHGRTMLDYVSDFQDILDQLGITGRFYVLGYSFGAQHAAVIASHYSERILAAGLIAPVMPPELGVEAKFPYTTGERVLQFLVRTPLIGELVAKLFASLTFEQILQGHSALIHFAKTAKPEYIDVFRGSVSRAFNLSHVGYVRGGLELIHAPWGFDFATGLAKVRALFVAYGTKDTLLLPVGTEALLKHLPTHTVVEKVDDDHMFMLTELARMVKRVVELWNEEEEEATSVLLEKVVASHRHKCVNDLGTRLHLT